MTEMSTVSEMSTASGVSTVQPPAQDADNKIIKVGYGIIVLLLVMIGVVYMMRGPGGSAVAAGSGGSGGDDDSDDDKSGGGGGGGGGGGFIVGPPTSAPTKFVRRSTTTAGTTSPTPDTFQEPPRTPPPLPKKLVTQYDDLVLCTLTHRAQWEKSYPPDGQCDLLFYTSVRYHVRTTEFSGAYDMASYDLFLRKAKAAGSSSKTAYGASFEYEYAQDAAWKASKLKKLWNSGVYHFGILRVWDTAQHLTSSNAKLDFIKEAKKHQDSLGRTKKAHRVLGFQVKQRSETKKTRSIVAHIQKYYPITILITVTHTIAAVSGDYSEGPTSWNNSHVSYTLSLIAEEWRAMALNESVAILPSFSMAAATWKLTKDTYTDFSDGSYSIQGWGPSLYEPICLEGKGAEDSDGWYMYEGSGGAGQLMTWDNPSTLLKKVMAFFGHVGRLPKKHGWALYDVDYDDPHSKCKGGSFARVRHINRYMRL